MPKYWSLDQAQDQSGKVAIITGANVGLGYETALGLAKKNAQLILACRNVEKAESAKTDILELYPETNVECRHIDTSSLTSVREFADGILSDYKRCDLLINNAGIMMTPREKSVDGHENQLATNYLGHFLLTGLLLPLINSTDDARVVTLSSLAHKWTGIKLDDINSERRYSRTEAYGQSKLACLMFALELQQRLSLAGKTTKSFAAHPGFAATELVRNLSFPLNILEPIAAPFLTQPAAIGAMPTLYAALGEDLAGGEYTGPAGFQQRKGPPTVVRYKKTALDTQVRKQLWALTEELCGYEFLV